MLEQVQAIVPEQGRALNRAWREVYLVGYQQKKVVTELQGVGQRYTLDWDGVMYGLWEKRRE